MILLSPSVPAQSGKVCVVYAVDYGWGHVRNVIEDRGCERDDVLNLIYDGEVNKEIYFTEQLIRWCRFDRDIKLIGNKLLCVLVSTEPRPTRDIKSRSE